MHSGQLAITQSSVVDPGRFRIATPAALCYVCPVILTPETRGSLPKVLPLDSKKNIEQGTRNVEF